MPVKTIQNEGEVREALQSGKPTVVHYWDSHMGSKSPLAEFFDTVAEDRGDIDFYIVDSGIIPPPHGEDDLPLTVLYINGEEVESAPMDPDATMELIDKA